ncbi:MAG: hypothetical protein HY825_04030 [Acidobacteria bacterium]|nr:hypothetical protein [Acidobacteriota bacterium]
MSPTRLGFVRATVAVVAVAQAAVAQVERPRQRVYVSRADVVARRLYFDLIDAAGRPVDGVDPAALTVVENGVERPVLEVRRRLAPSETPAIGPVAAAVPAPPVEPPQPQRYVLVALDPTTLGKRPWGDALDLLSASAEALAAIGPVDVLALTTPILRAVTASRDPQEIREGLARVAGSATPLDVFYRERARFIAELERVFDAPVPKAEMVAHALQLSRELVVDEEFTLRHALARLDEAIATAGRPAVVVWAAQGDPDTAEFVRGMLPVWFTPEEEMKFTAEPLGLVTGLEGAWRRWADDGVTVVSWSQAGDWQGTMASPSLRHPIQGHPRNGLGIQPFTLFESVAEATGGALVQSGAQLRTALATVGGRFELVYQTDDASPGWREIRIVAKDRPWTARYSPRLLVPRPTPEAPRPAIEPLALDVALTASLRPAESSDHDVVDLPVVVDLAPLRERLGVGAQAQFVVRISATPPSGRTMAREVAVRVASLPAEGNLRYETSLVVPRGTTGFRVEVREQTTGALGSAGPWEPPVSELAAVSQVGGQESADGGFAGTAVVRIGEARFVLPQDTVPSPADVRVIWKGRVQQVLRVAGGPGSSLEIGVAIDVSESAADERAAFARTATAAANRLLGSGDRVFRVDFGRTSRFLGAAHDGAQSLFAASPVGRPEKTAIFDGLGFALAKFEQRADRRALIVFTDGCETTGRSGLREVERAARSRAIPVFVILADGQPCRRLVERTTVGARITSVTPSGKSSSPQVAPPQVGALQEEEREGAWELDDPASRSRFELRSLAKSTGGSVITLRSAEQAADVWTEVERALARLWVAVYEPTDARSDPREVEVRSAAGRVLRPGP